MYQRTPEVFILKPSKVVVETVHVPPRRREAYRFVGCEQNKSQDCEVRRQPGEAEKEVSAKKLRNAKEGKAVGAPVACRNISQRTERVRRMPRVSIARRKVSQRRQGKMSQTSRT